MGGIIKGFDPVGLAADFLGGERQQDYTRQNMEYSQAFNAGEAQKNRDFEERMSNTSWQRGTADMLAAGINPMLAFMKGGASTPSGSAATSSAPGGPAYHMGEVYNQGRAVSNAAQVQAAQADNIAADSRVKAAQEENIRADTRVKEGQPDVQTATAANLRQQVDESRTRMQELHQRIKTQASSAAELEARANLLRAQLPQVQATIGHLNAMARMNDAQVSKWAIDNKKTEAETREIIQRVKQNLPELQAMLQQLEFTGKQAMLPKLTQEGAIHSGEMSGYIAALLKIFNPLAGLLGGN